MARTVILEFDEYEEHDVFALVESLQENRGIMVIDQSGNMKRIYSTVSGVYTDIFAIEGKEDTLFKMKD